MLCLSVFELYYRWVPLIFCLTELYMCITHFCTPSLHDYDVKVPNFTFCGGRKHKTTTFFFFS